MAITKVGADVTATVVAGTPQDITLPTLAENDIVILAATSDNDIDGTGEGVTSAGWNNISDPSGSTPGQLLYWKRMGATPDTIVNFVTDAGADSHVVIQCWRGVDTTTAIDATPTSASAASGMPNPPAYTTVTDDALRIIVGHLDDDLPTNIAAPTGYTNLITLGVNLEATSMMASKIAATAGAEDPEAFTGGAPNSDAWHAYHFALRPSSGAATQNITGVHFSDADTFHTSVIGRGAVGITGVLYTDADAFHTAVVSATYGMTGVHFADADTFHASVATATYTISGVHFSDPDIFHTATIIGAQEITGVHFSDADTFHVSTISSTYAVIGSLYSDADVFHTATISASYTISGVRFDDPDNFFTSVTTATYAISGGLFSDGDTFFTANVSSGAAGQDITGVLYSDSDSFFGSTISSTYSISGGLYTDPDIFFAATISGGIPPVISTNAFRDEFRSSLRLALRIAL